MDSHDYPVNYEKTLFKARQHAEIGKAISNVDEIEDKWVRISQGGEYSLYEIKKEALLDDIVMLLRACITLINRIADLEQLVRHRKPNKLLRQAKKIAMFLGEK